MYVLTSNFLLLKALHIIFVVTWFAGLFYLPRLFVYHAVATDAISLDRFKVMERRLFAIMTMGAVLAVIFGGLLLLVFPGYLTQPWLKIKLSLVVLLIGYHLWCFQLMRQFALDRNSHSHRWYRWFNEAPTLLLFAIVILVVVKPGM